LCPIGVKKFYVSIGCKNIFDTNECKNNLGVKWV